MSVSLADTRLEVLLYNTRHAEHFTYMGKLEA